MELEEKNKVAPHLREAHKALAHEVITFLHGEEAYTEAVKISEALFSGKVNELTADEIQMTENDLPLVMGKDYTLAEALIECDLAKSKREAREFIRNGAVLVNGEKVTDEAATLSKDKAIEGRYIVLRRGKKLYALLKY